ncbi:MAG: RluA family pseudouridine synthase [Deltaproteobacteria bacterium]|nr:MAG: RluA family pseudouridine synthase [Deltaproteobacteria bacterium]
MTTQPPIINISSYRFAHLQDLKTLRNEILELCLSLQLKGTILLSTEGINLFVAGFEANIETLMTRLRQVPGLEQLTPKISRSDHQPFRRMLVKIKKEIIAFGIEGIDPVHKPAPKLSARELKKWLDEKKPITLLDTRNDYEVKLGTFKNAINPNIQNFKQFPKFAESLDSLKEKPVVMFCTGGIRCEKAGPLMEKLGFKNIFQLDGGILKYFEEVGSDHYDGDCFVFDGRVGVDPALAETPHKMCFACLSPLTIDDQKSPKYILGKSCPHCFKNPEEHMSEILANRHEKLRQVTENLGKTPYKRRRPIRVPQYYDGKTLLDCVSSILKHMDLTYWKHEMDQGLFETEDGQKVGPEHIVKTGERYFHTLPSMNEPPINGDIKICYEDEALIIVEKPAPLPVIPSGRFDRHTLQYILDQVYLPKHLRPIHRLDSNTTGLLLLAKTRSFAAFLHKQFANKSVEKTYRVKIKGHPQENEFTCNRPISDQPGDVGSRTIDDENGLEATTHFKVLERLNDGTSLLEARPITGRTNQIRVHLWSLGYPICGDTLYLANQQLGNTQTTSPDEAPLCLHASHLAFIHPITQKRFEIESKQVAWLD